MNKSKLAFILLSNIVIVFGVLLHLYLPSPKPINSDEFSSKRVESYIETISREPHSIHHPKEREVVRKYLSNKLESFGYKVERYKYDSIIDRFGNYINIENLYTKKEPLNPNDSTSYILLIAHLDSRFKHPVRDTFVLSCGAADDGYGLGIILEIADLVSRDSDNWNNGIKILFTDSEESDLEGISNAYINNNEIFKNVALAINIEARGVKGPAILFETSDNNQALIKYYQKNAKKRFGFSMTSTVYNILPNFTDFTVIKDSINGYNFSVIDNLEYYHTNKDNFYNINLASIQHYGEQIYPIVSSFLRDPEITGQNHFESTSNSIFFVIPFIGFFVFSKSVIILLSLLFIITYIFLFWIYYVQKRVNIRAVLKSLLSNLIFILLISVSSFYLIKYITVADGLEYKIMGLAHLSNQNTIELLFISIPLLLFTIFYLITDRIFISPLTTILSAILFNFILSIVAFIFLKENVVFFVPSIIGTAFILMSIFKYNFILNYILYIILIIFTTTISYLLFTALSIGSIAFISFYTLISMWMILPMIKILIRND